MNAGSARCNWACRRSPVRRWGLQRWSVCCWRGHKHGHHYDDGDHLRRIKWAVPGLDDPGRGFVSLPGAGTDRSPRRQGSTRHHLSSPGRRRSPTYCKERVHTLGLAKTRGLLPRADRGLQGGPSPLPPAYLRVSVTHQLSRRVHARFPRLYAERLRGRLSSAQMRPRVALRVAPDADETLCLGSRRKENLAGDDATRVCAILDRGPTARRLRRDPLLDVIRARSRLGRVSSGSAERLPGRLHAVRARGRTPGEGGNRMPAPTKPRVRLQLSLPNPNLTIP